MRTRVMTISVAICVSLGVAACGANQPTPAERLKCSDYKAFSASGSLEGGGAPTPLDAAKAIAGNSVGFNVPADGWVQLGSASASGTDLRSGDVQVTAVQLKDGTWAVFSGKACN